MNYTITRDSKTFKIPEQFSSQTDKSQMNQMNLIREHRYDL